MMDKNIVAIIPARGGSKGIPRKNITNLAGKPLISYGITAALQSKLINRVIVSTDDKEIEEISSKYGAEVPFMRPAELATDTAPTLPVLQHAIKFLEENEDLVDIVVLIQPTTPLIRTEEIDKAIEKLIKTNADSVVSVCEIDQRPEWMYTLNEDKIVPFSKKKIKSRRRQDLPKIYILNGGIWVMNRNIIMKKNKILGRDTRAIIMPKERSKDIDEPIDFDILEIIIKKGYK